jgi:hypothetical protein
MLILSKVLDHPELYEAYPELKDYQVYLVLVNFLLGGSAEFHSNRSIHKVWIKN